jgi:hypothetical protein
VTTLLVGAASFCCLGIALTAVLPDAAAPIVNALLLPLYSLRRLIPDDQLPSGVIHFADLFDPPLLRGLLRRPRSGQRRRRRAGDLMIVAISGRGRSPAGNPLFPLEPRGG